MEVIQFDANAAIEATYQKVLHGNDLSRDDERLMIQQDISDIQQTMAVIDKALRQTGKDNYLFVLFLQLSTLASHIYQLHK